MSIERKMIGLSAQAHSVPPVPIDYGTRGTPSLVVKTTKGTNQIKNEHGRKQIRNLKNHLAPKAEYRIRSKRPRLETDCFHHTQNKCHSPIAGFKENIWRQRHFQFLAIGSSSFRKLACWAGNFEPDSMKEGSPKIQSGNRRWQHPPPISPRPPGDCLWKQSSNPISEIKITKQAESHPTGFLIDKQGEKVSPTYQFKPRAHLLHRTIERYHE